MGYNHLQIIAQVFSNIQNRLLSHFNTLYSSSRPMYSLGIPMNRDTGVLLRLVRYNSLIITNDIKQYEFQKATAQSLCILTTGNSINIRFRGW